MARPAPDNVQRAAVIGAGTIGASWAARFLASGLEVAVFDPAPDTAERVRRFVDAAWPTLDRLGLADNADPSRITVHPDPAAAVRGAQFVQENGPENLTTKRELLGRMEAGLEPWAIVASSTSGLLASDLQSGRDGPERYVVGHPFNPPHLIPLVEVVGGRQTDPGVVDWTADFYRWLGKRPIKIRREVPGHVANRMQAALYREAIHLVLEGVASIEDVDAAIAYGPGLRWAIMGPHMLHHLAGGAGGLRHLLEHIGPGIQSWWGELGTPEITPEVIDRLVGALEGTEPRPIEALAGERDALLIALLETLAETRGKISSGSTGDV